MTHSQLHGRVAVVTHGAGELGRGICAALAHAGATVVVGDEQAGAAAQVTAELVAAGGTACSWQTDAARISSIDELIQHAVSAFSRVDIMLNSHSLTSSAPAETMPLEMFTRGIAANLSAMFFGCQYAARQMLKQSPSGGTIINITSVGGVVALPGQAAFCSAMAAMNAVTKVLATEWRPQGIRVVALGAGLSQELAATLDVHPVLPNGETTSHRRIPRHALTSASDVGQAVVYLASEEAQHITGTTLVVDGGWLADGYWE